MQPTDTSDYSTMRDPISGDMKRLCDPSVSWGITGCKGWARFLPWMLICVLGVAWATCGNIPSAMAQDGDAATAKSDAAGTSGANKDEDKDVGKEQTLLQTLIKGGIVGLLIVLLSVVAVYFVVEHSMTIRKSALMPEVVLEELETLIAARKIDEAIEYCNEPDNYSLVSTCVLAGLECYQGSEFGFAEYKSAIEEEGEDQTGQLYRKTEVLGLIGQIAPMLGLTGTVLGMINAFNSIAASGGMAKPAELAGGIGLALVTTLLGLFVAIPSTVAFSFFRNKIDSIVSEAGKRIERIMVPLSRQKK